MNKFKTELSILLLGVSEHGCFVVTARYDTCQGPEIVK